MRFNIFRNKNLDAQVSYLLSNYDQAVRNSTEYFWRDEIAKEVKEFMEETLADVDEFYGQGSEYEVLSHTIYNLLYVIRHKANPPLNAR